MGEVRGKGLVVGKAPRELERLKEESKPVVLYAVRVLPLLQEINGIKVRGFTSHAPRAQLETGELRDIEWFDRSYPGYRKAFPEVFEETLHGNRILMNSIARKKYNAAVEGEVKVKWEERH